MPLVKSKCSLTCAWTSLPRVVVFFKGLWPFCCLLNTVILYMSIKQVGIRLRILYFSLPVSLYFVFSYFMSFLPPGEIASHLNKQSKPTISVSLWSHQEWPSQKMFEKPKHILVIHVIWTTDFTVYKEWL